MGNLITDLADSDNRRGLLILGLFLLALGIVTPYFATFYSQTIYRDYTDTQMKLLELNRLNDHDINATTQIQIIRLNDAASIRSVNSQNIIFIFFGFLCLVLSLILGICDKSQKEKINPEKFDNNETLIKLKYEDIRAYSIAAFSGTFILGVAVVNYSLWVIANKQFGFYHITGIVLLLIGEFLLIWVVRRNKKLRNMYWIQLEGLLRPKRTKK